MRPHLLWLVLLREEKLGLKHGEKTMKSQGEDHRKPLGEDSEDINPVNTLILELWHQNGEITISVVQTTQTVILCYISPSD